MSKKRKREPDEASLALVDIYNQLADEDENIRLQAAHSLLKKFTDPSQVTHEQITTALKRLLRGLCSNRKAARIGFSIALTEFLSQIFLFTAAERGITQSDVVHVLETQTSTTESVSRQDVKDHYLGRLFGAEAFIKSGIFADNSASDAWGSLTDLICDLATKKPWLRQECGWVLYNGILTLPGSAKWAGEKLLTGLQSHDLIRTPEGVAIWLAFGQRFPDAIFPSGIWKHDNPLYKKEKSALAKVMRDATPKREEDDKVPQAQGSAVWKAQLHFAWNTLLDNLYSNLDQDGQQKDTKTVPFEQFWTEAVDESLFAASSSSERKHTGFLVCHLALTNAPPTILSTILKGNVLRTLINQLASGDRLLHRAAQRVIQVILARASESSVAAIVLLNSLLTATEGPTGFDQVTKTKTIEKLINGTQVDSLEDMGNALVQQLAQPGVMDLKHAQSRRQTIADLLVLLYGRSLVENSSLDDTTRVREQVLQSLVRFAYFTPSATNETADHRPPVTASTRQVAQTRLQNCLERTLKMSGISGTTLNTTLAEIRRLEKKRKSWKVAVEMDEGVRNALEMGWTALESIQGSGTAPSHQAFRLLLQLSILQIYNGEPEAVQILEELVDYAQDLNGSKPNESGEPVIEILLSFSSKPSKFLRRVVLQVFQSFASSMTASGLQSLLRILQADENAKGQQELFDTQPSDEDDLNDEADDDTSSTTSDVEMIDSDVEEISQATGSGSDDDAEEEEDVDETESDGDEDDELAAFDAKLAAALGTRKGEDDLESADTSGSDDDMDDDQMEALDEHLVSVFRARKDMVNKKKEHQEAKGNIVQFKNRVLDLLEAYLKQEYLNPLALGVVLPLLTTTRKTRTKQIADRTCQLLREFCSRCKGRNVPAETDVSTVSELLQEVHDEVCFQASQAHATACSQASILLVKVLVSIDSSNVSLAVDAYAELRKKQLIDKSCHVQPSFFTDWNNWCANASQQLKKGGP